MNLISFASIFSFDLGLSDFAAAFGSIIEDIALWFVMSIVYWASQLCNMMEQIVDYLIGTEVINSFLNTTTVATYYNASMYLGFLCILLFGGWQILKRNIEPDKSPPLSSIVWEIGKCTILIVVFSFIFTTAFNLTISLQSDITKLSNSDATTSATIISSFVSPNTNYISQETYDTYLKSEILSSIDRDKSKSGVRIKNVTVTTVKKNKEYKLATSSNVRFWGSSGVAPIYNWRAGTEDSMAHEKEKLETAYANLINVSSTTLADNQIEVTRDYYYIATCTSSGYSSSGMLDSSSLTSGATISGQTCTFSLVVKYDERESNQGYLVIEVGSGTINSYDNLALSRLANGGTCATYYNASSQTECTNTQGNSQLTATEVKYYIDDYDDTIYMKQYVNNIVLTKQSDGTWSTEDDTSTEDYSYDSDYVWNCIQGKMFSDDQSYCDILSTTEKRAYTFLLINAASHTQGSYSEDYLFNCHPLYMLLALVGFTIAFISCAISLISRIFELILLLIIAPAIIGSTICRQEARGNLWKLLSSLLLQSVGTLLILYLGTYFLTVIVDLNPSSLGTVATMVLKMILILSLSLFMMKGSKVIQTLISEYSGIGEGMGATLGALAVGGAAIGLGVKAARQGVGLGLKAPAGLRNTANALGTYGASRGVSQAQKGVSQAIEGRSAAAKSLKEARASGDANKINSAKAQWQEAKNNLSSAQSDLSSAQDNLSARMEKGKQFDASGNMIRNKTNMLSAAGDVIAGNKNRNHVQTRSTYITTGGINQSKYSQSDLQSMKNQQRNGGNN